MTRPATRRTALSKEANAANLETGNRVRATENCDDSGYLDKPSPHRSPINDDDTQAYPSQVTAGRRRWAPPVSRTASMPASRPCTVIQAARFCPPEWT